MKNKFLKRLAAKRKIEREKEFEGKGTFSWKFVFNNYEIGKKDLKMS